MTRREREKKEEQRRRCQEWKEELLTESAEPANAAKYLSSIEDLKKANITEVVLIGRTSNGTDKEGTLSRGVQGVRKVLEPHGIKIATDPATGKELIFASKETGKSTKPKQRPTLLKAIAAAKTNNLPLVAASPSRFLRHPDYDPRRNNDILPTAEQYEELVELAGEVVLATCCDPNVTIHEDESFLTKLSQSVTGKKGGNKPKSRRSRKKVLLPTVKELRERGMGYKTIAQTVTEQHGVPLSHMTVKRWLRQEEL